MEVIELTVTCMGCSNPILTPSDAEPTLFRNGLRVHNEDECLVRLNQRLENGIYVTG